MAGPFLKVAAISTAATQQTIRQIARQIQVIMFATGAARIPELQSRLFETAA
jgi:isopentenyl diphosphate isomerase/L-lactate dehydrogenase-like FMN-dependent dehydrogenase